MPQQTISGDRLTLGVCFSAGIMCLRPDSQQVKLPIFHVTKGTNAEEFILIYKITLCSNFHFDWTITKFYGRSKKHQFEQR